MSDPWIVEVPPGTTRLDLRPVLEPIIRGLIKHSANRAITGAVAERWWRAAVRDCHLIDRMARIDPQVIWTYLTNSGWHVHAEYWHWQFSNREGATGSSVRFRAAETFVLKKRPGESDGEQLLCALYSIAKWEERTHDAVLSQLEEQAGITAVDRLGDLAR